MCCGTDTRETVAWKKEQSMPTSVLFLGLPLVCSFMARFVSRGLAGVGSVRLQADVGRAKRERREIGDKAKETGGGMAFRCRLDLALVWCGGRSRHRQPPIPPSPPFLSPGVVPNILPSFLSSLPPFPPPWMLLRTSSPFRWPATASARRRSGGARSRARLGSTTPTSTSPRLAPAAPTMHPA